MIATIGTNTAAKLSSDRSAIPGDNVSERSLAKTKLKQMMF